MSNQRYNPLQRASQTPIDPISGLTATNVQDALDELQGQIGGSISGDTFITGTTYTGTSNRLDLFRNDDVTLSTFINAFSGLTITGDIDVQGSITNSTGNIVLSGDTFVDGGILVNGPISNDVTSTVVVNDNLTVNGNAVVHGNVQIIGTATTINTEILRVADNIVTLNSNLTGATEPIMDAGIEVLRGSATTATFLWDEGINRWVAGVTGETYEVITTNSFGNLDKYITGATFDNDNQIITFDGSNSIPSFPIDISNYPASGVSINSISCFSASTNVQEVLEELCYDYEQLFFVSQHTNASDSNDGKHPDRAFRTLYKALDAASLVSLSAGTRGVIVILDSGIYDHADSTGVSSIPIRWDIYGPSANVIDVVGTSGSTLTVTRNQVTLRALSLNNGLVIKQDTPSSASVWNLAGLGALTLGHGYFHLTSGATSSSSVWDITNGQSYNDTIFLLEAPAPTRFVLNAENYQEVGGGTTVYTVFDIGGGVKATLDINTFNQAFPSFGGTSTAITARDTAEVCITINENSLDVEYDAQDSSKINVVTCEYRQTSVIASGASVNVVSAEEGVHFPYLTSGGTLNGSDYFKFWDSSDSEHKFITLDDLSSYIDSVSDTFVTGFTRLGSTVTISQNQGESDLSITLDASGVTVNPTGNLSSTNVQSALEELQSEIDDLSLTGDTDNFVSGGTYNTTGQTIDFTGTDVNTTFSVDVSDLLDDTNTFLTGATLSSGGTLTLTRNDDVNISVSGIATINQVIQSDNIMDIYQTGTTINSGVTYVDIAWDSTALIGSDFNFTGSTIEILSEGYFEVVYSISIDRITGGRGQSRVRLSLDEGTGFSEITRTGGFGYHRTSTDGESTITKNIKQFFNVGDLIKAQFIINSGGGTMGTIAGDSNITITKLAI